MSLTNPVSITLPPELLLRIESSAAGMRQSVEDLTRDALNAYVQQIEAWESVTRQGREIGKSLGIQSEDDVYRMIEEYKVSKKPCCER